MSEAQDLLVIPARYGSSRLPGKPLMPIAGVSLLHRTIRMGQRAIRDMDGVRLVVATDDRRIVDHAALAGCDAVMTALSLASGSDRAFAVARAADVPPTILINLQGDAPFISAQTVTRLLETARSTHRPVSTPVVRLSWEALDVLRQHKKVAAFSGTTCVVAGDGRAMWFSKTILPAISNEAAVRASETRSPVFRHLGLYAYRLAAVPEFGRLPPSHYERMEGLEQLRLLEAGIEIQTCEVEAGPMDMSGIDTAEDIAMAERLLDLHGDTY